MSFTCRVQVIRRDFTLDVDLTFPKPSFVALVGASGSGKTTLLRCVAGLERASRGEVTFEGTSWQAAGHFLPTHLRPIGYVFQEASLFPHLDVTQNLAFGLSRTAPQEQKLRFDDVVALLGVGPLLRRLPADLSGGERQRVAMARALLTSPRLLLLDEPLASLDVESRAQIMPYLAAVHARLRMPVLYVTHSPSEVVRLADEIVYLDKGRVAAHGPINEILTRADLPLSRIDEAGAALDAEVVALEPEYHLMQLAIDGARLVVSRRDEAVGAKVRVFIRARDVGISLAPPEHTSILNVLTAKVLGIYDERDPAHRLLRLSAGGQVLLARVTHKAVAQLELVEGRTVYAHVKSVALVE